jgi:hypothetical protein
MKKVSLILGMAIVGVFITSRGAFAGCGPPQCTFPNPSETCQSSCADEGHSHEYCKGRCDILVRFTPAVSQKILNLLTVPQDLQSQKSD